MRPVTRAPAPGHSWPRLVYGEGLPTWKPSADPRFAAAARHTSGRSATCRTSIRGRSLLPSTRPSRRTSPPPPPLLLRVVVRFRAPTILMQTRTQSWPGGDPRRRAPLGHMAEVPRGATLWTSSVPTRCCRRSRPNCSAPTGAWAVLGWPPAPSPPAPAPLPAPRLPAGPRRPRRRGATSRSRAPIPRACPRAVFPHHGQIDKSAEPAVVRAAQTWARVAPVREAQAGHAVQQPRVLRVARRRRAERADLYRAAPALQRAAHENRQGSAQ